MLANNKDCNLNQIKKGVAWHYKQYQDSQSEFDRVAYSNTEVTARLNKVGLWSSETIVAPWDFRRLKFPNYQLNNTLYDLENTGCSKSGLYPENHLTLY